jgi:RadC-like JAB domain/Uncharacterized protein conserved in bacteria (DUF2188)
MHVCTLRVASPRQILEQAQRLVSARFHRKRLLIDQPHVVRALLQVRLAAHPRVVFAALFLDRRLRLLDYVELFTGALDQVVIHPREVIREALRTNAAGVIVARNDPSGDGNPSSKGEMVESSSFRPSRSKTELIYENKSAAIARAKQLARHAALGQVKVHGSDGVIQTEYTHGRDPRRSPG